MSDSQLRFEGVGVLGADGAPALDALDLTVARGKAWPCSAPPVRASRLRCIWSLASPGGPGARC